MAFLGRHRIVVLGKGFIQEMHSSMPLNPSLIMVELVLTPILCVKLLLLLLISVMKLEVSSTYPSFYHFDLSNISKIRSCQIKVEFESSLFKLKKKTQIKRVRFN